MNLVYVHPGLLHEIWPTIRPGVEAVAKTHDHWIPEDLYAAIKAGTVGLYVNDGPENVGFVAVQQQDTEVGKIAHIWALYSSARDFGIIKEGHEQIKAWAKKLGANAVTFSTTRKGWERQAKKLGFEPDLITYRCKL